MVRPVRLVGAFQRHPFLVQQVLARSQEACAPPAITPRGGHAGKVVLLVHAAGDLRERTALGLVMNLNSDYLKFDFDKADLHPSDKELLSRVERFLGEGYRLIKIKKSSYLTLSI